MSTEIKTSRDRRQSALASIEKRKSNPDPTEAEIAQLCATIRESWSPAEFFRRWALAHSIGNLEGLRPEPWQAPQFYDVGIE